MAVNVVAQPGSQIHDQVERFSFRHSATWCVENSLMFCKTPNILISTKFLWIDYRNEIYFWGFYRCVNSGESLINWIKLEGNIDKIHKKIKFIPIIKHTITIYINSRWHIENNGICAYRNISAELKLRQLIILKHKNKQFWNLLAFSTQKIFHNTHRVHIGSYVLYAPNQWNIVIINQWHKKERLRFKTPQRILAVNFTILQLESKQHT